MPEQTRAIAYLRVSTSEQAQNGYGLEAQNQAILDAVLKRDWTLKGSYTDRGASGKDLDRPELFAALWRLAEDEADALIVSKLDRLTRSVIDFATLLDWFDRAGKTLVALDLDIDTSTPGGKLVAQVFAAVAEWERETIAARTREGLAVARAEGRLRPAVDGKTAALICSLRDGGESFARICEHLNDLGIPTVRGGKTWRPSALQGVLGGSRRVSRRTAVLPEIRR